MIKQVFVAIAMLAASTGSAAQDGVPPPAAALWTIASDDCQSVHADGEPWDECGFQAFAMNADASRVLTVSALGAVQLWDGAGREIRRIEWPDAPGTGASGFPSGRAAIVGTTGVAVVHHNQLLLIDLADGRTLAQRMLEDMTVKELAGTGPDRVQYQVYDRSWRLAVREILLPSGEIRDVAGAIHVAGPQPRAWIAGGRAPFVVHSARPEGEAGAAAWGCVPVAEHFCFSRDLPGRLVHMLDLREGSGTSYDAGRTLGEHDSVYFAVAGDRPYALICGRSQDPYPPRDPCHILDMARGRPIYTFESTNRRVDGGLDERGRPELRLSIFQEPALREQRRVSAEGGMRVIDAAGRANLSAPGGGMIIPGAAEGTSILVDTPGGPVALLPFPAQTCGNGWPDWSGFCRISADGRRWLVPRHTARREGGVAQQMGLTLYAIPSGAR